MSHNMQIIVWGIIIWVVGTIIINEWEKRK